MSKVMVRYTVKPECVEENERLVRAVYEELAVVAPAGFSYATFKLEDGLSFLHIASNTTSGETPLASLAAFKAFTAGIRDRAATPPVTTELEEIGAFNFWP